jgi:hypothetical protein
LAHRGANRVAIKLAKKFFNVGKFADGGCRRFRDFMAPNR